MQYVKKVKTESELNWLCHVLLRHNREYPTKRFYKCLSGILDKTTRDLYRITELRILSNKTIEI